MAKNSRNLGFFNGSSTKSYLQAGHDGLAVAKKIIFIRVVEIDESRAATKAQSVRDWVGAPKHGSSEKMMKRDGTIGGKLMNENSEKKERERQRG